MGSSAKQAHISGSNSVMDMLPADLIGSILSRLDSARSLAAASATCRKWHEAAMHHLYKLTFIESDFTRQVGHMVPGMKEIVVSKLVMKTSCLEELSITADSYVTFRAACVIEWLTCTRKTLQSFVFMNRILLPVNILEYLGGNLEELKWKFAYIPEVDPAIPCFQSLSFLHLMGPEKLTFSSLKALLLACPKLKRLVLTGTHLWPDVDEFEERTLELVSCSLTSLTIEEGLIGVDNLVLHIDCLVRLLLDGLTLKLLKLVHAKGSNALQALFITNTEVTQVHFDCVASSLVLLSIIFSESCDIAVNFANYNEVMSGASNLRWLALQGLSITSSSTIDLHKIAASFPRLEGLMLSYEAAFNAFTSSGSIESPFLEKVTVLEVACIRIEDEGFVQWIAEFLERCPGLRWLTIRVRTDRKWLGRFTTSMVQILRRYPHVEVKFEFF